MEVESDNTGKQKRTADERLWKKVKVDRVLRLRIKEKIKSIKPRRPIPLKDITPEEEAQFPLENLIFEGGGG